MKSELTDKQTLAIPVLLASPTMEAACKRTGLSRSTLRRWLRDENFAEDLEGARDEVVDQAMNALLAGTEKAVQAMIKTLETKSVVLKLKASDLILHYIFRVRELRDIEQRLSVLEKLLLDERSGDGY